MAKTLKFTVTIEMGNDAMQTGRDVARVLREVAAKVAKLRGNSGDTGAGNWIGDVNGNTLGEWGFTEE